jgi:hypothetical protein
MSQLIAADFPGRKTSASSSTFRRTFAKVLKYLNNNFTASFLATLWGLTKVRWICYVGAGCNQDGPDKATKGVGRFTAVYEFAGP